MSVNKEPKVATIYEILGIIILFLGILYILFPKFTLQSYLLKEHKNFDLVIKYLENLSRSYPEKIEFKKHLLFFYIKSGKFHKASVLLEKIFANKQLSNDYTFLKLGYDLEKHMYFKDKNEKHKQKAKYFLSKLLSISNSYVLVKFIYKESKEMDFQDLRYKSLLKLVKIRPYEREYLKELYQIAIYKRKYRQALILASKLYKLEKNDKWLDAKAHIYYKLGNINKASKIYLKAFLVSKSKKKKRKYFIKAVNVLLWSKKTKTAVKLAKKYENYFITNFDNYVLKRILNLYLQTNNLKYARTLSIKILKRLES